MIPDNCECCELEIGDGADCKRSRYDDEKQEVVPGNQCSFALLAAKERECERLRRLLRSPRATMFEVNGDKLLAVDLGGGEWLKKRDAALAEGGEE